MHTKNAINCFAHSSYCARQWLFMYFIWLWLVECIFSWYSSLCLVRKSGCLSGWRDCEMRSASYLTFHVQFFSIKCIWIALKRSNECKCKQCVSRIIVLEWMNEWMELMDKEPIFFCCENWIKRNAVHIRWIFNIVYSLLLSHMMKMQTQAVWHTPKRWAHCQIIYGQRRRGAIQWCVCIAFSCFLSSLFNSFYAKNWKSKQSRVLFITQYICYLKQ